MNTPELLAPAGSLAALNAAVRAGNNVQAAAFGMGTFSSHGMERTHVQAVMDTAKLLAAFIL